MLEKIEAYYNASSSKILSALLILALAIIIGKVAKYSVKKIFSRFEKKTIAVTFVANSVQNIVILLGLVMLLANLGVNVNALIASLSLFSFALGFALKDIISNTLSGLIIIIYEPFHINQYIKSEKFHGRVKKVNIRYTILACEKKEIYIPNVLLLKTVVEVHHGQSR